MLMTSVIQPEVFDRTHFSTSGYRDQVEMFLRGIQSNGLLIVDPNSRLLKEINDRLELLSTKDGQQLQIRLAELQKKERRRILAAEKTTCSCPTSLSLLEAAKTVQAASNTDTIIADAESCEQLLSAGHAAKSVTRLGAYLSSDFERKRLYCLEEIPPIDKMAVGEFDTQMISVTRFAKRVRFYDKQIGKGSSLGGFHAGIGRILSLWVANAHYPRTELSAEIYTCVQRTHAPTDMVYSKIIASLVRKLASDNDLPITFYFKEDSPSLITHDRFLQTDSVPVSFSKGFDYMEKDGTLQRCAVKIDNGAYEHLQEYRNLKNFKSPTTI
jgi:hypothetical protein